MYDLVVIGGGSGGLACSKEAARLGAKVAVLDFVKPSPHGSKWNLGGTCVNVGCIPKKLMHTAALLGESILDAKGYGWDLGNQDSYQHSWPTLRENVQDYIKGLNFGYRVQLREKNVTYLNKLGSFRGTNELACTDAKGKTEIITAARFVLAVGGRPTSLDCPGAEYAISSDDIFSLDQAPGKTCVVGAGYVALECAGFLAGLNQGDVTVLIRSIPLRGFDRDTVDRVTKSLENVGVKMVLGATPVSIKKLTNGKLLVEYSTGAMDEFDTVLAAVGRYADTKALGFENLPQTMKINPQNGKIYCSREQTSVSNIYAVGDVIDGTPELTPAAILAGKLLAQRLFGNGQHSHDDFMDYPSIPTVVFTPLELGTVGLTEDAARLRYGDDNIDCYISAFMPLEWSLPSLSADESEESESLHRKMSCFLKVVVDISRSKVLSNVSPKVVGIHIAAPHAGEIVQGFAVAFRKGDLTYSDLVHTVGIHPTIAEEFTIVNVTKSSGEKVEKTSC